MNRPNKRIVDLSHPLSAATPAFPGDPNLEIKILDSATMPSVQGERHLNSSHLSMGLHCGTHMDAPFHFFQEAATIDQVLLDRCIGPALLVDLPMSIHGATIDRDYLAQYEAQLRAIPRVVLNTHWHERWGADNYFSEHPVISGDAAQFLVECGVELIGVDTPSVDRPPFPAHLVFLANGVLIVENLTNLEAIGSEQFELIAPPLKILGRDGSPVRALAVVY